jgi:pSer/pThr/pTyr-binding forkhead associated (FHA) protein
MIQLRIVSGKRSGEIIRVKKFPWAVGRRPDVQLQLEDEGVWDKHMEICIEESDGFYAVILGAARGMLNGVPFTKKLLHNGDIIQLGAAKIEFRLADTRLRNWKMREWALGAAIVLLFLSQVAIIYWLFMQ